MKVFATADLHGKREAMDCLREMDGRVDLILICGDIGGKEYTVPVEGEYCSTVEMALKSLSLQQKEDAAYLDSVLDSMKTESYYILGNDDWFEWESRHLLKGPIERGGLTFIPFDLVNTTPFNTNREANENKLLYELSKLKADQDTIMVAHTPPFQAGDELFGHRHCGSRAVRDWIRHYKPKMWLCGHIHENFSKTFLGETEVLNCTTFPNKKDGLRGWLIDTGKGTVEITQA